MCTGPGDDGLGIRVRIRVRKDQSEEGRGGDEVTLNVTSKTKTCSIVE